MKTETNIATKLDELLQRVASLTRASDLKPTMFDDQGERHARSIAQRDQERTNAR